MNPIQEPWPWYVAGPLIGLTVPLLLIIGNKALGVSSSLRHICAACFPGKIPFFNYDWKKESWNLFFVGGIALGAVFCLAFMHNGEPVQLNEATITALKAQGVQEFDELMPGDIFNWGNITSPIGLLFFVTGGFMVGFGTRYANGCTSGHSIMGLSTLQWPSLVATICFMAGGFVMTNFILPHLMKWLLL
ncbi:YeeE/YedE family protein [Chitinophaga sp. SYP-B3965]|uniref:YeeE/YedE family protein n=1 Tax=Chitinophaga sp. SYP-B3965 TaxID=2663120 RepID=UPI001299E7E2|nr:YeeE/YedE thiosulfate transporter family protein [Chitinophaga sp. SYP-B3965]MRG44318.1 YeeE/YedE family protein [Chitinophaga sp. SYP-B3965]